MEFYDSRGECSITNANIYRFKQTEVVDLVSYKLGLVGSGAEGFYPSELSGGMRKGQVGRAMALDPDIFLDEPSAGLDPITSKRSTI